MEASQILDLEVLKYFVGLGVGGSLALVAMMFYRRDFLRERESREVRERSLLQMVRDNTAAMAKIADMEQREIETIERVGTALSDVQHAVNNLSNVVGLVTHLRDRAAER